MLVNVGVVPNSHPLAHVLKTLDGEMKDRNRVAVQSDAKGSLLLVLVQTFPCCPQTSALQKNVGHSDSAACLKPVIISA